MVPEGKISGKEQVDPDLAEFRKFLSDISEEMDEMLMDMALDYDMVKHETIRQTEIEKGASVDPSAPPDNEWVSNVYTCKSERKVPKGHKEDPEDIYGFRVEIRSVFDEKGETEAYIVINASLISEDLSRVVRIDGSDGTVQWTFDEGVIQKSKEIVVERWDDKRMLLRELKEELEAFKDIIEKD